jgi:hypothetical protein
MDEYTSEIFMGGKNTIVLHNTCEDSLLAAPIVDEEVASGHQLSSFASEKVSLHAGTKNIILGGRLNVTFSDPCHVRLINA